MVRILETTLERTRTSPAYRQKLDAGWCLFAEWCMTSGVSLQDSLCSTLSADQRIAEFVNIAFEVGHPLWLVKHAVLACQTRYRFLKGNIPRSWDCLRSWQAQKAWRNRVPITPELMRTVFTAALNWALIDSSLAQLLFPFCVLVRVGFHGLLRPGEIANLVAGDVRLPLSPANGEAAVIAIRSPKTRFHYGRKQFALITDVGTVAYLRWLVADLPPHVKLWPSDANRFRSLFASVLRKAGLANLPITPASLRAGGATDMIVRQVDIGRLKFLGRWKSQGTLDSYVQEAVAQLVALHLDDCQRSIITTALAASEHCWQTPPVLPWTCLFSRARQWRSWRRQRPQPTHGAGQKPS